MLTKPKDSKERRCLNYFSTFFEKRPYLHNGECLYSDAALIHLMNRQKMVWRGRVDGRGREERRAIKKKKSHSFLKLCFVQIHRIHAREQKENSPFTNFEHQVGIESHEFPTPAALEGGKQDLIEFVFNF